MVWQLPNTWHMVYQKADFNISCLDALTLNFSRCWCNEKKVVFEHLFWLNPLPYGLTWLSSGPGPYAKTLASLLSHSLSLSSSITANTYQQIRGPYSPANPRYLTMVLAGAIQLVWSWISHTASIWATCFLLLELYCKHLLFMAGKDKSDVWSNQHLDGYHSFT